MGPISIKNLLTAFSPKGDYLAIAAGDGRVKTWDAANGFVSGDFADMTTSTSGTGLGACEVNGHLAVDYSCMEWNPASRKGKKKSGNHGLSSLLGLGTGSGDVLILDTALGQVRWSTKDCHSGGVKSLAFDKSGSIIYSAGADGMVCKLDVGSGQLLEKFRASKRSVSCIAVSGDGNCLVAASGGLRLFELSSRKRIHKFTGHPNAVKHLAYTEDDKHFISSAIGERYVAVWQSDGSKHGGAAACVLSMEYPAVSLHCSGGFSELSLRVLAVSEAGLAYVWHASSLEELSTVKPVKIAMAQSKSEASSARKSGKNLRSAVLAARFIGKNGKGHGSVLVAYGTTVKPNFDRVSIEGQNDTVLLQTSQEGALLPAVQIDSTVGKNEYQGATILGPDNAIDAIRPRTHVETNEIVPTNSPSSKKKRRASIDIVEDSQNVAVDRLKLSGAEKGEQKGADWVAFDENEETMEDKLKALGILQEEGIEKPGSKDNMTATPKADSLQVLMTQALLSDDNVLLEQCLSVTDERVIANTIRKLKASDAAKFLQLSVFKLDARTKRSLLLVPWIKGVLLHHASYIMSNPSMQSMLNTLYQIIDARLSVFRPLLSLSGRLDVIMAQISTSDEANRQEEIEPAAVYEESDNDVDEEVEDVMDDDMEEERDSADSEEDLNVAEDIFKSKGDGFSDANMTDSDED